MAGSATPNPYAPPATDESNDHVAVPTDGRPNTTLATALKWALGFTTVINGGQAISIWMQVQLLSRARDGAIVSLAEGEANDTRIQALALAYMVALVGTGVLWCVWQNRTSKSARARGAENMEYGPDAWGWFFCPIVNLWRPSQVVRELWIMADHQSFKMTPPTNVFALWWGSWLVGGIASRLATKTLENAEELDLMITASWGYAIACLIFVAAGVGAIQVVTAISSREQDGYARLQAEE